MSQTQLSSQLSCSHSKVISPPTRKEVLTFHFFAPEHKHTAHLLLLHRVNTDLYSCA